MKGLEYKTIKECYDAQQLLIKYRQTDPTKIGDRTYGLGNCYIDGKPHPQVLYSQQEITIYPSNVYRDFQVTGLLEFYPDGVSRVYFRHPEKEYVTFLDASGTKRFYLIPKHGLRIQRDGTGYKAMNPVPDYHIEVDRSKAREARKPAEDLYNYLNSLWDMLPDIEYKDRPMHVIGTIPAVDDREAWYDYLIAAKYAKYGALAKDTILQRIRSLYTEEALAYKVVPVPDTQTDHTLHWDKLDALRAAGMLEIYEGKQKKTRTRKASLQTRG